MDGAGRVIVDEDTQNASNYACKIWMIDPGSGNATQLFESDRSRFVTGGSKFDPAVGRGFFALGFTIIQAYGLTETSGAATLSSPNEAHLNTVGRALPGQVINVLPL